MKAIGTHIIEIYVTCFVDFYIISKELIQNFLVVIAVVMIIGVACD